MQSSTPTLEKLKFRNSLYILEIYMYSVCVSVHRASPPPPPPLAVMKGKLIPPSGHGLRNQFGTTELPLFWKSGKWDQHLQQERTCRGSVGSSFPGAPEPSVRSVTDLARRRYLGGHRIPRLLGEVQFQGAELVVGCRL